MVTEKKNKISVKGTAVTGEEKKEKIKEETIKLFSRAMSALSSNENRLKIALIIKNEKKATFAEIKGRMDINNSNLRFHLKKLQETHIISQNFQRGPYKITELGVTILRFFELLEEESSFFLK